MNTELLDSIVNSLNLRVVDSGTENERYMDTSKIVEFWADDEGVWCRSCGSVQGLVDDEVTDLVEAQDYMGFLAQHAALAEVPEVQSYV